MSYVTLLDKNKTLTQLAADKSDGIGILHCTAATVTEEHNGAYTASFSLSILDKHFSALSVGSVVRMKPNDTSSEQLFRVHYLSKPMMGIVKAEARHISYDLLKAAVTPFSATGITNALKGLKDNMIGAYPFTTWTDITNETTEFSCGKPISFRGALGGVEGSILDQYGGEYEWDNLTVKIHKKRGSDNGVSIEYGKNLTDAKQEENNEEVYNAILPYAVADDVVYNGELVLAEQTDMPKTLIVDFTEKFDEGETPTLTKLNNLALTYIARNKINVPKVNITVKFVPLWQSEEYKDIAPLQSVALGDTVHVTFDKLGITTDARVMKTVYNVLQDRYDSIQIGDKKNTLAKTISGMGKNMESILAETNSNLKKAIYHATELITGGLGGHLVINTNAAGEPNELLIMDTDDKDTAVNVWRFNLGGLGHSHSGYNGPFDDIALTMEGAINANMITTGELSADRINGGTINAENINVTNINGQNIKDGTIGSNPLATGAVIEGKLGDLAVSTAKLGDLAVSNGKIGNSAVSYGKTSFTGTLDQVGTNTSNISANSSAISQIVDFVNNSVQRSNPNQYLVIN